MSEVPEKSVFSKGQPERTPSDEIDLSESRPLTPFKIIRRGEDTLDDEGKVVFADYSPGMIPSDIPDKEPVVEQVPKVESAQGPVSLQESTLTSEPQMSDTPAQEPVTKEDGQPSPSESLKQSSSTRKSPGSKEQPASEKPPTKD